MRSIILIALVVAATYLTSIGSPSVVEGASTTWQVTVPTGIALGNGLRIRTHQLGLASLTAVNVRVRVSTCAGNALLQATQKTPQANNDFWDISYGAKKCIRPGSVIMAEVVSPKAVTAVRVYVMNGNTTNAILDANQVAAPGVPPEFAGTRIPGPTGPANSADIRFTAPEGVKCSTIVFIQAFTERVEIVNTTTGVVRTRPIDPVGHSALAEGFPGPSVNVGGGVFYVIDYLPGEADAYYNGYDNNDNLPAGTGIGSRVGAPVASRMFDRVTTTNRGLDNIQGKLAAAGLLDATKEQVRSDTVEFETAAFCAGSSDNGKFLGVVRWNHSKTRKTPHNPGTVKLVGFASAPSESFLRALREIDQNGLAGQEAKPPGFVGPLAPRLPWTTPKVLRPVTIACTPAAPLPPAGTTDTWTCTLPNDTKIKATDLYLKFDQRIRNITGLDNPAWPRFRIDTRRENAESPTCDRVDDDHVRLHGTTFPGGAAARNVQVSGTTTLQVRTCVPKGTANPLRVIGIAWTSAGTPLVMGLDVKSPGDAFSDPEKRNRVGSCMVTVKENHCSLPLGSSFSLGARINSITNGGATLPNPDGDAKAGYTRISTIIRFPAGLSYKTRQLLDEIVWPECSAGQARTVAAGEVRHECTSATNESVHVGNIVAIVFNCDQPGSHTMSLAGEVRDENGNAVVPDRFTVGGVQVTDTITINCVPPTPTPTRTRTPTPTPTATTNPIPVVRKLPPLQNLFLTRQGTKIPPVRCVDSTNAAILAESINVTVTGADPKDLSQPQRLGGFSFQVKYDPLKVCVVLRPGPAWSAHPQQVCTIIDAVTSPTTQGVARMTCVTLGKATVVDTSTAAGRALALIEVRPQPEAYSQIRANQDNGQVVQLNNEACKLTDLQGHAIPILSCEDADVTIRFLEGDVEPDCQVNTLDTQAIAFRWGATKGSQIYNDRFNLEPSGTQADQDIDINDLQFVYGRFGSTCASPWPVQVPVKAK